MFLSRIIIIFLFLCVSVLNAAEPFVTFISADAKLPLVTPQNRSFSIWCDDAEHRGVLLAVRNLQTDFEKVTTVKTRIIEYCGKRSAYYHRFV